MNDYTRIYYPLLYQELWASQSKSYYGLTLGRLTKKFYLIFV